MSSKIHVGSDESKLPVWTKSLLQGKKKDAAKVADNDYTYKRPKPSKVAPKPSPKPSRSPKATGHPSRKNKGAASERTGSNASKANTGRGNWI